MSGLPTPRLLPITIAVTAILLGLKSLSLGQAALASDPSAAAALGPDAAITEPAPPHGEPPPIVPASVAPGSATAKPPATMPSDWPLLQELRDRREALERREHALDLREAALQAATHSLQTELGDLRSLKTRLETLEAARQQRSDVGWRGIVKVYEAMRPTDAAAIFNSLDAHLLVQILDRMNERKAALVMGNMDPERARVATQMLATYRERENADPVTATAPSLKSPGNG